MASASISWCGIGDDYTSFTHGISACVYYSLLSPTPAIIFLCSAYHQYQITQRFLFFGRLDNKTMIIVFILQLMLISAGSMTFALIAKNPQSFAYTVAMTINALSYFVACLLLSREAWRLTLWPRIYLKLYFVAMILVAICDTLIGSSKLIGLNVAMILLSSSILLLILFKHSFYTSEEREKMSIERVSVDVYDGNIEAILSSGGNVTSASVSPYDRYYDGYSRSNSVSSSNGYSGSNGGTNRNGRSLWEQLSGFWEENILRPLHLSAYFYRSQDGQDTSTNGYRGEEYSGNDRYLPPGGGDGIYTIVSGTDRDVEVGDRSSKGVSANELLYNLDANMSSSSLNNGGANRGSSGSIIRSALDPQSSPTKRGGGGGGIKMDRGDKAHNGGMDLLRKLQPSLSRTTSLNDETVSSDGNPGRGSIEGVVVDTIPECENVSDGFQSTQNMNSNNTTGNSGSATVLRNLQKRYDRTGGPLNTLSAPTSAHTTSLSPRRTGLGAYSGVGPPGSLGYTELEVRVLRWGITRERMYSDGGTLLGESAADRQKDDKDCIEFEVQISLKQPSSPTNRYSNGYAKNTGWDKDGSAVTWSVWKTPESIMALHSSIVINHGESAAPRRPRLKCLQTPSSPNRHMGGSGSPGPGDQSDIAGAGMVAGSDYAADMRTISLYLMALVRNKDNTTMLPVLSTFLQLPSDQDSANNSGYNSNVSSVANSYTDDPGGFAGFMESGGGYVTPRDSLIEGLGEGEKDKELWRKLYTRLRVSVKPHDAAIKVRFYEGVVCGSDVLTWLQGQGYSEQEATDVGENLARVGYLRGITRGYAPLSDDGSSKTLIESLQSTAASSVSGGDGAKEGDDDAEEKEKEGDLHPPYSEMASHALAKMGISIDETNTANGTSVGDEKEKGDEQEYDHHNVDARFCALPFYLYKFQAKSNTSSAGLAHGTLLGSPLVVTVPSFEKVSHTDDDGGTHGNANQHVTGKKNKKKKNKGNGANKSTHEEVVMYTVACQMADCTWSISKRFRDFESLNNCMYALSLPLDVTLPSKMSFDIGVSGYDQRLEERREGIERWMECVVRVVAGTEDDEGKIILAHFLDDAFMALQQEDGIGNA